MITILAVAGSLVALAIATPVPNWRAGGGMVIPLSRQSSFLDSNQSVDLDTIISHGISVREKILSGLDNYERNTGSMHPLAVKRDDSELVTRGTSLPLTSYLNNLQWMGEISIGTPPQILKLPIDTGSADMWVLQTGCTGIPADRVVWDPKLSQSTNENTQEQFLSRYSDGSVVKGGRYTDTVSIAGLAADHQTFGSVTSYTSPLRTEYPADGLLGLAFPSVSRLGADTLFVSLVKQNKVTNPTFSFKFSSPGGEMYLGGTNSLLYTGAITYTRVTTPGLWQVSVQDVRVNGNQALENVPAIFDTGASFIVGDWERIAEMYEKVDGARVQERRGFGFYYLPCESFPTVSFTFGGRTFPIPPEVLKLSQIEGSSDCLSAIIAQRSRTAYWNIGLTFLRNVYSVFDYGTLRIGFAELT